MSASLVSSQCLAYKVWHTIQSSHVRMNLGVDTGGGKYHKTVRPGIIATNIDDLATKVAFKINAAEEGLTTPAGVRTHLVKLFAESAVRFTGDGRAVAVNSVSKRHRSKAVKYSKRSRSTVSPLGDPVERVAEAQLAVEPQFDQGIDPLWAEFEDGTDPSDPRLLEQCTRQYWQPRVRRHKPGPIQQIMSIAFTPIQQASEDVLSRARAAVSFHEVDETRCSLNFI